MEPYDHDKDDLTFDDLNLLGYEEQSDSGGDYADCLCVDSSIGVIEYKSALIELIEKQSALLDEIKGNLNRANNITDKGRSYIERIDQLEKQRADLG